MEPWKFLRFKEKREERGEEKVQVFVKRTLRLSLRLLLFFILVLIGHRIYLHLLETPFFQLKEVEVRGCRALGEETIRSMSIKEGMPNLFAIELKSVAKPLESHPWIDHVSVRKVFPNKILIEVEERKPVAILYLDELYYVDAKGVIFSSAGNGNGYDYPFLTGLTREALRRNPEEGKALVLKALEFLRTAESEKASPFKEISEIHMERSYGIQCYTKDDGTEVRMGMDQFGEKLRRLSMIWSDLPKRSCTPVSIDCSDLRRYVVRRVSREKAMGGGGPEWGRKIR